MHVLQCFWSWPLGQSVKICLLQNCVLTKSSWFCVVVQVGAAFMSHNVLLPDGKSLKFEIWDTAGQASASGWVSNSLSCLLHRCHFVRECLCDRLHRHARFPSLTNASIQAKALCVVHSLVPNHTGKILLSSNHRLPGLVILSVTSRPCMRVSQCADTNLRNEFTIRKTG